MEALTIPDTVVADSMRARAAGSAKTRHPLSGPDAELERIYHFRWWTYRKHLRIADLGFGFRKTPQTVRRATLS